VKTIIFGCLAQALLNRSVTKGGGDNNFTGILTAMKILMCVTDTGGAAAPGFEAKIDAVAGDQVACISRDTESLQDELRKPYAVYDLVILFAGTVAELEHYVSLQDLLEGIPVLLILPENRADIFRRAHLLRPRFISFADSDFSDFTAVLQKMILNRKKTASPQEDMSACI
jgi:hypothetical protein